MISVLGFGILNLRFCFVCLGNICRSPLAEGVFKQLAAQAQWECHVESAGTGGWHVGEAPDARSQRIAQAHGLRLTSRAQQFRAADFARFDHILALDEEIAADLRALARTPAELNKIRLLREYDPRANGDLNVPDPYYGGLDGFEGVYEMIERSCRELIQRFSDSAIQPESESLSH